MSVEALNEKKLSLEIRQLERRELSDKGHPGKNGTFFLLGGVDDDIYENLMLPMWIWSKNNPKKPITLLINSPGGTVIDGFAFYDFLCELKRRGHKLITKGIGIQASMGGILMQAGDERILSPRSHMMIHEVQGFAEGSTSEMKNVMKFNERLQDQALDILARRSSWSRGRIKKAWKDDVFLDAETALKAGFVDKVEEDI